MLTITEYIYDVLTPEFDINLYSVLKEYNFIKEYIILCNICLIYLFSAPESARSKFPPSVQEIQVTDISHRRKVIIKYKIFFIIIF